MPSGVMRLRAAREAKAKRAERDAPPAAPRKPLKAGNKNPNTRIGALGDHEPLSTLPFNPEHGTGDVTAYAGCCDHAPHAGAIHAGPHSFEVKARQKWVKEQERGTR
jgi:hypothetical protein